MGFDRIQLPGAALSFDGLTPDRARELDRLWPGWRGELRATLEQLTECDDPELCELAREALSEFDAWAARS